jgi:hypothetical protein
MTRFFHGAVICLLAGFVYGCAEAFFSLGEMKTSLSSSSLVSVPYRGFLGGAFYSQVFFLAWID